ncbi:hypothetical protein CTI14_66075, partial [Methylobacterium radiotolerans]
VEAMLHLAGLLEELERSQRRAAAMSILETSLAQGATDRYASSGVDGGLGVRSEVEAMLHLAGLLEELERSQRRAAAMSILETSLA